MKYQFSHDVSLDRSVPVDEPNSLRHPAGSLLVGRSLLADHSLPVGHSPRRTRQLRSLIEHNTQ